MTDVASRRLRAQRLTGEPFASVRDAVAWMGAVQSQDYAGAKWALNLRTSGLSDADLDRLFDAGAILRTHVLRPTWHFVLPEDIRWLLELTGPRVKSSIAPADRRIEIDGALLRRSHRAIETALRDGAHLTRSELADALERAGIPARAQRLSHLVMHAELDAVVVSGPRRGRQFTYGLLDERAPGARRLDRDEALAELARRYFASHGPAQVPDFTWWSGLTAADARRGLALAGAALAREDVSGRSYWSAPDERPPAAPGTGLHLLPNFDEFLVAYRDRSAAVEPADAGRIDAASLLGNVVLVDGRVRCGWKRRMSGGRVVVELDARGVAGAAGLERAVAELARFLGLPVSIAEPAGP